jgi:DNA-binding Xre family transcriptional regulator
MAKLSTKRLTPEQIAKVKRDRELLKEELPELLALGRRIFERHERLREALRALRAERKARGVSLAELARRTGIAKASLSRLENDPAANPTIGTLDRIAAALGKKILIQLEDDAPAAA